MDYREILPVGCPPAQAEEITVTFTVYRFVRQTPVADEDFRSQRAERPQAAFAGVSECQARGLSVFRLRDDCEKIRKLPALRNRLICRVQLGPGAGSILPTGKPSHHTWWPLAAFDILACCTLEGV